MNRTKRFVLIAILATTGLCYGQYSESFDDSSADVTVLTVDDTAASYLDYSSLGISEAPRTPAGATATSGIRLEANLTAGAGAGVNVLAGATPITFSGDYTLSYDMYMSYGGTTGSTELANWMVGSDGAGDQESRYSRAGAVGTWGWIAGENGFGTEDAAIFENDTELADLGDTQLFEDGPFNAAFVTDAARNPTDALADPPNGAPVFEWVQVDVNVSNNGDGTSNVSTNYNGVEFFNADVANASVTGFAGLGYEDPFGSVNDAPELTYAVFDNLSVTPVPEPSSAPLLMLGLMSVVALRRRR